MWHRRQLIRNGNYSERNRPVRWSHSPIRLRAQYGHVYLTTPAELRESIRNIGQEDEYIYEQCGDSTPLQDPAQGDYKRRPYRYFLNSATDLLKYVYYFSAAMALLTMRDNPEFPPSELNYAIVTRKRDFLILRMYPDVLDMEGETATVEGHWLDLMQAATRKARQEKPLPYFEKAFVQIKIITPRGADNTKVWDASNRAVNFIINNLKGVFFHDEDMEQMAFSVFGSWGEQGVTIIRVSAFDESRQIGPSDFKQGQAETMGF